MTRVSVVMPVFNGGAHLEEALASVFQQTRAPDEIVVVDDGSTDNSPEILKRQGSSIRTIRTDNRGLAAARNEGLRLAQGPLVGFLDQDDRWVPRKLEIFLSWAERYPNVELMFSDSLTLSPAGHRLRKVRCDPGEGELFRLLFRQNRVVSSTVLLTKSLWERAGPFRGDFAHPGAVVDWEFFLRASRLGAALYVGEPLTEYRIHPGSSLRSRLDDVHRDQQRVLSLHEGHSSLSADDKRIARAMAFLDSGVRSLAAWDPTSARTYFSMASQSPEVRGKVRMLWGATFLPRPLLGAARAVRGALLRLARQWPGRPGAADRVRFYDLRPPV